MIIFYSEYCDHSTMLIKTIKKHDKNKRIKLVSIDYMRSNGLLLDEKIHSVPALMLLPSRELMFGKIAFDYLLLPTRGILFQKIEENIDNNSSIANNEIITEPSGFTIDYNKQTFESIDENTVLSTDDMNFSWSDIENTNNTNNTEKYNDQKKILPSMDQIISSRESDLL